MSPTFFETPARFRAWLEKNHASATELLVGYYKRGSGKPSITWPESVDEALCFGWIDGVRRGGDDSYTIRFTPRKKSSNWSNVNVARVAELTRLGKMAPAGLRAFEARKTDRTGVYSFERTAPAVLSPAHAKELRANRAAAAYFDAQPPWYRRTATHWVTSAKRDETRDRRFAELLRCCAAGRTIPTLTPREQKPAAKRRGVER